MDIMKNYYAVQLRDCWAVRPTGQLGTCGFYPFAWVVIYVKAKTEQQAIYKALFT